MMSSKALQTVLTTPSKIASALDWKKLNGAVLALNIHADRISAAVASHPSFGITSTTASRGTSSSGSSRTTSTTTATSSPTMTSAISLPDLPLGRRATVTAETRQQLQDWVKEHRICGVVVSWPIQPDTGRMGASCGRVLRTLDQLLPVMESSKRPLCLWDAGDHSQTPPPPDAWGRSPAFAPSPLHKNTTTETKILHLASVEQYHADEGLTATQVWDDFCQAHWPELCQQQQQQQQRQLQQSLPSVVWSNKKSTAKPLLLSSNHSVAVDDAASHWNDSSSNVKMVVL